jgi:hypothetical protein
MLRSAPLALIASATGTLLMACNSPGPLTGCAGVGAWGLVVSVEDSASGAPAAAGATLLTYDQAAGGVRVDSTTGVAGTDILRGADDRPGRYSVTVRKAGFRDWVNADVVVHNGCPAIQTVALTARLARP